MSVLLIHAAPRRIAGTVHRHIDALASLTEHRVFLADGQAAYLADIDLACFDAVILHYSLELASNPKIAPAMLDRIGEYRGIRAVFLQDEYRGIDAAIAVLARIKADILFTCVPEPETAKVYAPERLPGLTIVNVLTGYVDAALVARPANAYADRPIDIGYRARRLPYSLGALGQEKWRIGSKVKQAAGEYGLAVDISHREEDRLYGSRWISFVQSCKAVLGTESGASVFDFDGGIKRRVQAYLDRNPGAEFDVVRARFLADYEGKIRLNQISPRCFEAAALRTLMILYEGDYSGLLEPWRHFVPLRKDHENMAEVFAVLRDPARAGEIIERAYDEVARNPDNGFPAFARSVDVVLAEACRARGTAPANYYTPREWAKLSRPSWRDALAGKSRAFRPMAHDLLFGKVLGFLSEKTRNDISRRLKHVDRRLRGH